MTAEQGALLRLVVASLFLGAVLGALYDAVRISRVLLGLGHYTSIPPLPTLRRCAPKAPKPGGHRWGGAVLFLEDMLFCLAVGVTVSLLLFSHNSGEFRGFVPLCLGGGFLTYYFTVGRLVIRVSEYVVFGLRVAVTYLTFFVSRPFVWLGLALAKQLRRLAARHRERKLRRYTVRMASALQKQADNGFLENISILAGE